MNPESPVGFKVIYLRILWLRHVRWEFITDLGHSGVESS